jgi:hypothetical protein
VKRGGGLRRTGGLARTAGPAREKSLDRGDKPLRRKPRRLRPRKPGEPTPAWELERIAAEAWHNVVVQRGPCLMCKAFPVSDAIRRHHADDLRWRQGHHVIAKRHLKAHGLTARLWDSDNGLCLCAYHHERHERAIQRVPLGLLPRRALRFADEIGLAWILDREYAA